MERERFSSLNVSCIKFGKKDVVGCVHSICLVSSRLISIKAQRVRISPGIPHLIADTSAPLHTQTSSIQEEGDE